MPDAHVYTCIRVRPPVDQAAETMRMEISDDRTSLKTIKDISMISSMSRTSTETKYKFDHIFDEASENNDIFENVWPLLRQKMIDGENANFCVYGQTGSGKTHTIDGIISCILPRLFRDLEEMSAELELHISYVQIYLDSVYDLLNKNERIVFSKAKYSDIEALTSVTVKTPEEVSSLLDQAQCYKKKSEHALNKLSSRSHTILKITAKLTTKGSAEVLTPTLFLVDLAGSERNSRTMSRGTIFEEGCQINKSLSCLAKCLESMTQRQALIPFRESLLTMFLRDALNSAGFILVCCISPEQSNESETRSTINFATVARRIVSHRQSLTDQSKRKSMREQHEQIMEARLTEQRDHYEAEVSLLKSRLVSAQTLGIKHQTQCEEVRNRLSFLKRQNERHEQTIRALQAKPEQQPDFARLAERVAAYLLEITESEETLVFSKSQLYENAVCNFQNRKVAVKRSPGLDMQEPQVYKDEMVHRMLLKDEEASERVSLLSAFAAQSGAILRVPASEAPKERIKQRSTSVIHRLFSGKDCKKGEESVQEALSIKRFACESAEQCSRRMLEATCSEEFGSIRIDFNKSLNTITSSDRIAHLESCVSALSIDRNALASEADRLQKKLIKSQRSTQRIAMEKARNQCIAKEALARAEIGARESSKRRKLFTEALQFFTHAVAQNNTIALESRRRSRAEVHAFKFLLSHAQKFMHLCMSHHAAESKTFSTRESAIRDTLTSSQKRVQDTLEDNKALVQIIESQNDQMADIGDRWTDLNAQWSLQSTEMYSRCHNIMDLLSTQSASMRAECMVYFAKSALSLEATDALSHIAASFWRTRAVHYHDKALAHIDTVDKLQTEIESNSEMYAQIAMESDDWQSAAVLWKTRCESVAKVLQGKALVDIPGLSDEEDDALSGHGFESFLSALIRISPPRGPRTNIRSSAAPVTPQSVQPGRASYGGAQKLSLSPTEDNGRKTFAGKPTVRTPVAKRAPSQPFSRPGVHSLKPKASPSTLVQKKETHIVSPGVRRSLSPALQPRDSTHRAFQPTSRASHTVEAPRIHQWKPKSSAFIPNDLASPTMSAKRASPYRVPKLALSALNAPKHSPMRNGNTPCKCSVCTGSPA